MSLKAKALKGFFWSFLEKTSVLASGLILGIILARLLDPSDYGLIGMLAVFIAVSRVFVEGGFTKALVQKQDRTETDFSTVFYFNVFISLVFYLAIFKISPMIGDFYGEPRLVPLSRVLGLCIIISSFTIVQNAKLQIALDFKAIAKINFTATLLGGLSGVYLAFKGFGVWALVFQILVQAVVSALMLWYKSKWTPILRFSSDSFYKLFGFGSKLLMAGLLSETLKNIYRVAIGKYFPAAELGYYQKSSRLAELPSNTLSGILHGVSFPILSSLQDDKAKLVSSYKRLLRMTMFLIVPMMILLSALAEPLIIVLFTRKWIKIVPLLPWLCLARAVTPISVLNMNILNAIGRSDLFLKLDCIKAPIVPLAVALTIPYGVEAVVIGAAAASFLAFFINAYYPKKFFDYGAWEQLKDLSSMILPACLMYLAIFVIKSYTFTNIQILVLAGSISTILYLLAALALKIPEAIEIREQIEAITEKIMSNPGGRNK